MRLSLYKCYQKPCNKSKTVACGLLSAGDGLVCVVFLMCRVWSGEFVFFPFYEQPTLMLISLKFIQQKNSQCNLCQSHPRSPNLYCYGLRAGDVLVYVAPGGAGMQWSGRDLSQCQRWALPTRDGHIALSNHSYHSLLLSEPWFPEREGVIKEKDQRATSELTNSHFEWFALEQFKEKRVDQINERF